MSLLDCMAMEISNMYEGHVVLQRSAMIIFQSIESIGLVLIFKCLCNLGKGTLFHHFVTLEQGRAYFFHAWCSRLGKIVL